MLILERTLLLLVMDMAQAKNDGFGNGIATVLKVPFRLEWS